MEQSGARNFCWRVILCSMRSQNFEFQRRMLNPMISFHYVISSKNQFAFPIFRIFWFSWFCLCLFSQNWLGAQTWTIKYHIDFCHRRVTKKNFMKFWRGTAEICGFQNCQFGHLLSHISQLSHVRTSWIFFGNSPMTEVNVVFYGPCLGTSPVLRKWAWKKPWKSRNAKKCHFP